MTVKHDMEAHPRYSFYLNVATNLPLLSLTQTEAEFYARRLVWCHLHGYASPYPVHEDPSPFTGINTPLGLPGKPFPSMTPGNPVYNFEEVQPAQAYEYARANFKFLMNGPQQNQVMISDAALDVILGSDPVQKARYDEYMKTAMIAALAVDFAKPEPVRNQQALWAWFVTMLTNKGFGHWAQYCNSKFDPNFAPSDPSDPDTLKTLVRNVHDLVFQAGQGQPWDYHCRFVYYTVFETFEKHLNRG